METTNKWVHDLVKDVTEYKLSLNYTQTQVDNQKKTSDEMQQCAEMHAET